MENSPFEIIYFHLVPLLSNCCTIPYHSQRSAEADVNVEYIKSVQQNVLRKLKVSNAKYKKLADEHRKESKFEVRLSQMFIRGLHTELEFFQPELIDLIKDV